MLFTRPPLPSNSIKPLISAHRVLLKHVGCVATCSQRAVHVHLDRPPTEALQHLLQQHGDVGSFWLIIYGCWRCCWLLPCR